MNNSRILVVLAGVVLFAAACGSSALNTALDKARFALNSCSITSTAACTDAVNQANAALAIDANNLEAAMMKSSAQATSGGFNLLTLLSDLASQSGTDSTRKFKLIHSVVGAAVSNIADLRSSIESLTAIAAPASTNESYEDYYFQLGFLQMLEAFARPTLVAQPTNTSAVTPTTVAAADKTYTQSDFLDADGNLILGGIADSSSNGWDLVKALRQNYCVLHNLRPAGTTGFTLGLLQDLVLCQLCIEVTDTAICAKPAANLTAADFQSGLVTTCNDFNFTTCENAGPTEE